MNDIAFKVIIKNDGIDDVIFKTLMLKGEKGDKGDAGGAEIDDSTTSSTKTWSSNKIRNEIDAKPDNLSELDDVDLDSITDEQLLGYNFTSGKWENKSVDASTLKYDSNTSIKEKIDDKADIAGLATVATSGDYDDLSNKPTIPSAQVNSDWNATSGVAEILNKPTIPPAQVNADWNASSGVAEILNKPTIPVVDQTLNSSSSNAISNSAVANGLSGKADTSDTYTKTEVDNIVAGRKCINYSLVTTITLTGTETTFNTYGGRKFSDYDLYIFTFGSSDKNFRRTVVLTKSQWQSGANIDEGVLHGASTSTASSYDYCGIVVNYNTDTSIKAKVFGSGSINKFSIIGIKY